MGSTAKAAVQDGFNYEKRQIFRLWGPICAGNPDECGK